MELNLKLLGQDPLDVVLVTQTEKLPRIDNVDLSESKIVIENNRYEIDFFATFLNKSEIENIKRIDFFLNDGFIGKGIIKENSKDCYEGKIEFLNEDQKSFGEGDSYKSERKAKVRSQVFLLQYDLVLLSTIITYIDDSQKTFYGDYMLCVSKNPNDNENISNMLKELNSFNYSPINELLFNVNKKESKVALHNGNWKYHTYKSLNIFLQLVKDVVVCYQEELRYFQSNAKQKIQSKNVVEPFNKVRKISNNGVNWLMQNSNMLAEVDAESGIMYNGKHYIPLKMQTENKLKSLDVYENQVVLGFLYLVYDKTKHVFNELQLEYLNTKNIITKVQQKVSGEYFAPIITLKNIQVEFTKKSINKLEKELDQLEKLYRHYSIILPVKKMEFNNFPKKTKTFQEILSYIKIFQIISRWFQYGDFDFSKDKLILRVRTLDKLFEYYSLYKLLNLLYKESFKAIEDFNRTRTFTYDVEGSLYQNETDIPNTYYLERNELKATLYYQPVIKSDGFFNNISLYRTTNGIPGYYTPDFVIKFKDPNGREEYIILDSKFSSFNTIKKYQLDEIINKYSAQIAVAKDITEPRMVWILRGRVSNHEDNVDVWYYNSSPNARKNRPATSYGVIAINTRADVETRFWNEIKKNIDCVEW